MEPNSVRQIVELEERHSVLSNSFLQHDNENADRKAWLAEIGDTNAKKFEALTLGIEQALSLGPSPISAMTLQQMRAFSHFELGQMSEAADALSRAESLMEIFPHSTTAIYLRVLKAKVIGRDRAPSDGLEAIYQAWLALFENNTLTADAASALLRGELDLRRLSGQETLKQSIASRLIETAMGEELYAALALQDCYLLQMSR